MIYIECKPDRALLLCCLPALHKRQIIHEFKGKYEICKRLAGSRGCQALLDEDPDSYEAPYIQRLRSGGQEERLDEHGIEVLRDDARSNTLILLCPTLEAWVLAASRDAGIDVSKYGLPDDSKKLHSVINVDPDRFGKLLDDLRRTVRLTKLRDLVKAGQSRHSRDS